MMTREPANVPRAPGVYALVNRKRRYAYVAYTDNLQKRSHSLSHSLLSSDRSKKAYWPIRNLPRHPSDEYVFVVLMSPLPPSKAVAAIAMSTKEFVAKSYTVVSGHRLPVPTITVDGKSMTLADALIEAGSEVKYLTAYRRIQRGWTPRQALGLDPPDPRWDPSKQEARRRRVA